MEYQFGAIEYASECEQLDVPGRLVSGLGLILDLQDVYRTGHGVFPAPAVASKCRSNATIATVTTVSLYDTTSAHLWYS